ncbi:TetR family transcriptional regulator [Kribbella sp. VKM Ac-2571]|uniref:TetR/AcrR family transcriptional regulator n=1 Tax=Kribbella sp. VKM Ac-2571 TaxID=2512222 RepID=UPI0010E3FFF8|nr:TetR/AcrR family transcriptional regulator [Kribbella sp. VKM Ac-2571]TDO66562.1 TetR family transcriptional regulator [Kribbella sp. VKM Ac-2571]
MVDPRAQRTIDTLLSAAEELFAARSVADVTVEEIAATAGVAVGSVYNHFGSKAGLYAALVERAVVVDRQFMDLAYVEGRGPVEQLYAAADEYLAFYLANPEYFRMLAFPAEPGSYAAGQELADRLADSVDEQNRRMVDAIKRGIKAGTIRKVNAQEVATVLWSSWNGIISLGWRQDRLQRNPRQLKRLLRAATDAFARGLLVERD